MPSVHLARQLSLYSRFASNATSAQRSEQAKLQEQMATGKRVNRASDDPTAFGQARQLEVLTRRFGQDERAITDATGGGAQTEGQLNQLTERFTEARDIAVRGRNDTWSAQERQLMANEVRNLRETAIGHLNEKHKNEYLFAGTETTTQPFDATGTPTGDLSGERRRQVGPHLSEDKAFDANRLKVNITGEEVLNVDGGGTIIEALDDLIDVLEGTLPMDDYDDILGRVDAARDHLVDRTAEAGTIGERLRLAEDQLRAATFESERQRSALEDAEYAEVITNFQQNQTNLQASLQMTSQVLQTSLLDFLR